MRKQDKKVMSRVKKNNRTLIARRLNKPLKTKPIREGTGKQKTARGGVSGWAGEKHALEVGKIRASAGHNREQAL